MMIPSFRVEAYNPKWNEPQNLSIPQAEVKVLRKWQSEAFLILKDAIFAFIIAQPGSGKSLLQVALAIYDVVTSNYTQKQLIGVPKEHVAYSFIGEDGAKYITIIVDGKTYQREAYIGLFR